jgi:N-carbamoyl-L-amino-acid hydrolase
MLRIDNDRFREAFEEYSAIGATENDGLHRLALTDADKTVRDRFVEYLETLGLDVRIDRIGNVFGRRQGTDDDADPVLIGSHLDSQPYGGRYDGQLGVLTALETIRTLDDEGIETERPIEIVNWTDEEGSRFHSALLGSSVFTGQLSLEEALDITDADGARVGDELSRIGYDGEMEPGALDVHSGLELHVEQGPRLEASGTPVGVVDGVFGIAWLRCTIEGETDHAGPSPMHTRKDAMAAAADAVHEINRLPNRLSADAISTVGEFNLEPDSVNVIPGVAEFTIDVRSFDAATVEKAIQRVDAEIESACSRHGVSYELEEFWRVEPMDFDPTIRETIAQSAADIGVEYEHLVSGAGHDAKYLNEVAPTGMIFVPSVDGITHNEGEFTEWEDCVAGANVFANTTLRLASGE